MHARTQPHVHIHHYVHVHVHVHVHIHMLCLCTHDSGVGVGFFFFQKSAQSLSAKSAIEHRTPPPPSLVVGIKALDNLRLLSLLNNIMVR